MFGFYTVFTILICGVKDAGGPKIRTVREVRLLNTEGPDLYLCVKRGGAQHKSVMFNNKFYIKLN